MNKAGILGRAARITTKVENETWQLSSLVAHAVSKFESGNQQDAIISKLPN